MKNCPTAGANVKEVYVVVALIRNIPETKEAVGKEEDDAWFTLGLRFLIIAGMWFVGEHKLGSRRFV
jgi:hypothetical protein